MKRCLKIVPSKCRVRVCIPTSHSVDENDSSSLKSLLVSRRASPRCVFQSIVLVSTRTRRFASVRRINDNSTFNKRKLMSTHSDNLTDAMFRLTAPPLTSWYVRPRFTGVYPKGFPTLMQLRFFNSVPLIQNRAYSQCNDDKSNGGHTKTTRYR